MASDAVSSVAYAIEEILLVLVPAIGILAFKLIPYLFILSMVILIIGGIVRLINGDLQPIEYSAEILPKETISGIDTIILLRAFSSGCSVRNRSSKRLCT